MITEQPVKTAREHARQEQGEGRADRALCGAWRFPAPLFARQLADVTCRRCLVRLRGQEEGLNEALAAEEESGAG